jgi:hypothetical protein
MSSSTPEAQYDTGTEPLPKLFRAGPSTSGPAWSPAEDASGAEAVFGPSRSRVAHAVERLRR